MSKKCPDQFEIWQRYDFGHANNYETWQQFSLCITRSLCIIDINVLLASLSYISLGRKYLFWFKQLFHRHIPIVRSIQGLPPIVANTLIVTTIIRDSNVLRVPSPV